MAFDWSDYSLALFGDAIPYKGWSRNWKRYYGLSSRALDRRAELVNITSLSHAQKIPTRVAQKHLLGQHMSSKTAKQRKGIIRRSTRGHYKAKRNGTSGWKSTMHHSPDLVLVTPTAVFPVYRGRITRVVPVTEDMLASLLVYRLMKVWPE